MARSNQRGIRGLVSSAIEKIVPLLPIGVSGLKRQGGYVYDEFHKNLRGKKAIETYTEMANNDAICGVILLSHLSAVCKADRNLKEADESPEALFYRDRIEEMFDDMSQTEQHRRSEVMTMEWAGFAYHEVVNKIRRGDHPLSMFRSKYNDGLVGLRKIPLRAQDSIEQWDFADDGGIKGAYQLAWPNFSYDHLPIERCLLYRIWGNKNNPEGRSILRNAYRSWWFLKRIQELEAIGVERDMAGLLVFEMPTEYFAKNATAAQKKTKAAWRTVIARARRGQYDGLVLPASKDKRGDTGFKASLMQSGGRRPMDVNEIVKRLESRIAVSVLAEGSLLGMQGNVGSWSLASDKTHWSSIVIKSSMQAIDDTENRYLLPRIMRANGWPQELCPWWEFGDVETDDSVELMNALVSASTAGIVTPTKAIEQYMLTRMGLPYEEPGELSEGQIQDAMGVMGERDAQTPEGQELESQNALDNVVPIDAQENSMAQTLSAKDAAEMLGVSINVINRAISRGQLPGNKVGGTYRVFREDLVRYMNGRKAA